VHVCGSAQRDFYQLDRLWSDRPRLDAAGPAGQS